MVKPTEKDFDLAAKMLHSNVLDYDEAVDCLQIMRAFLSDEKVRKQKVFHCRHLRNLQTMQEIADSDKRKH
jgi:hypothetical protein